MKNKEIGKRNKVNKGISLVKKTLFKKSTFSCFYWIWFFVILPIVLYFLSGYILVTLATSALGTIILTIPFIFFQGYTGKIK